MCPNFEDQVVQHAIFNYLEQIYEPTFIFDSYACRKGKGTHKACERVKSFINKHKEEDYFIKCDISKYFYSIDHEKLKSIISRKINDKDVLWLINKIIDSHKEESMPSHVENKSSIIQEKGIPIGNLMSQLFANIYLNELDYFVKHDLRVKHYLRYVDDFVILGKSHEEMKYYFREIQRLLSESLFLKLEEKKAQINKIYFGVDFTGYVSFKNHIRVRTKNYRRFVNKFNKKISDYHNNILPFEKLKASFTSYMGHLVHTNSNVIKQRIEKKLIVIVKNETVQRGGNWYDGAADGLFCSNLNNSPTDVNNNIGFRCCSEQEENALPSRRQCFPHAQLQLHSYENRSRNKTGSKPVIPAMIQ
jgi:hypothetical protein